MKKTCRHGMPLSVYEIAIVHGYMNLDIELVLKLVQENQLKFIIDFLLQTIDTDTVS